MSNRFLTFGPSLLLGMILMGLLQPTQALPSDWNQEMVIQSDRAELDRKTGMIIYEGRVELVQGTLKIQSERLLVIMDGNRLKQAVAEGDPAHYQQQVTADKPITYASAQRIDFYADSRELAFTGSAELRQENNRFSGENIRYQLDTERVTASGSEPSPTEIVNSEQPAERVRVVIQPNTVTESPQPQSVETEIISVDESSIHSEEE
ncbi:MAG: lipopolysaccharide transport periplasmic protein LptA [Oceanobacter sp.]